MKALKNETNPHRGIKMNIIDAAKSGKKFKRKHMQAWFSTCVKPESLGSGAYFAWADIVHDDWEIEEEKIEITREQIKRAFKQLESQTYFSPGQFEAHLAELLGFKN